MAEKYFLGSVGKAEAFKYNPTTKKLELAFVSKTLTDSSISIQTTKDDIRAGQGAPIQFSFYHDPSVEITLTDVLWKKEYVEAQLGANFKKTGGKDYKTLDETVKFLANSTTASKEITDIEKLPIPCGGEQYLVWGAPVGTMDYVKMEYDNGTLTLAEAPAVDTDYCIRYYGKETRAHVAEISTQIIPEELYLVISAPIFAGDACSASKGKAAGKITFEVPRFQLNGAQEFQMNMSSNQTMSLNGIALASESAECDAIGGKLLNIIEVITNRDFTADVKDIMSDEETQVVNQKPAIYAIMKDGTVEPLDVEYLVSIEQLVFEPASALNASGAYAESGDVKVTLKNKDKNANVADTTFNVASAA